MTTIAIARKGAQVAIAADTMVTFGDTRLAHGYELNDKLIEIPSAGGASCVATAGTTAHFPALRKALLTMDVKDRKLHSKDDVYDTFLKLHPILKEQFFLQTKEDDADPYESMQFTVLIANSAGIFGLYSYREVFEFQRFWGIGSGRNFALGAMQATYDRAKSAAEVVKVGAQAGCEFDKNSGGPIQVRTFKLRA